MAIQEIILYIFAALAYFVPFYIGWFRKVNGLQLLFWFNLLFAWTIFGWFLMIIVALSLRTQKRQDHSFSS
jgi:hypothetical protein